VFTTAEIGDGNAIARHGIHGVQRSFEFPIRGRLLQEGENSISITQTRALNLGLFLGVMYDYIRLKGLPIPHGHARCMMVVSLPEFGRLLATLENTQHIFDSNRANYSSYMNPYLYVSSRTKPKCI
jgi:hypothetical protein